MTEKPTYRELEQKIKQLEREVLEYLRMEKEFNEERKMLEYSHIRRTISLMKINEELKREIKELKRSMLKCLLKTAAEILLEKLTNNSLGIQNPGSKFPGNHINHTWCTKILKFYNF
jgi:hypothetical protein